MQSTMPVRSSNSSVLKWPDHKTVDRAARSWSTEQARSQTGVLRLGYFGSYARGDWGVGSDLDLIAVITETSDPFERRSLKWDLSHFPVPADLIVYTLQEWEDLQSNDTKFARMLRDETVWLFTRND
jgi:predicted nucleotidyltransferase